jgi:glutamate 5-kinase
MSRSAVTTAKRVVIKIGSSSLTGTAGSKLDSESVSKIVDLVASLRARGAEVLLVSSGAIAAGLAPLGLSARPKDLATQQAAASVGQGLLIAKYNDNFSRHNLISSQVLLTTEDVVRRSHYQNAQQTLNKLLSLGVVPIINENDTVGTQEIRFGDNDRLAALVSLLVKADLLVLISDVDALYDAPPSQSGAKAIHFVDRISEIENIEIGGAGSSGVGSGGMVTKIEAARISTSSGIPMLLTSLAKSTAALMGEETGTFFAEHGTRSNSRLLWLAHASTPCGRLILDAGAVTAIQERGVSLLPAGVTSVEGEFISGDTVELVGADNKVIARGLVAFDSDEIPQMLGRSTKELATSLGAEFERELVHRDDLVLL